MIVNFFLVYIVVFVINIVISNLFIITVFGEILEFIKNKKQNKNNVNNKNNTKQDN
ncbi:hypothetical protein HHA36_05255 [Spiroplasma citri]|nr:hypothetical protein HHA36_05255 [Spiroplasma citri]